MVDEEPVCLGCGQPLSPDENYACDGCASWWSMDGFEVAEHIRSESDEITQKP
ncbi:MAG: hypothetical protein ACFWUG_00550 [Rahnella inusitata]|jgi:predicted amidophosphoribosyltransferase